MKEHINLPRRLVLWEICIITEPAPPFSSRGSTSNSREKLES